MDFVDPPLLAAAVLVCPGVLAGLLSVRIGLSFLLPFLAAGMRACGLHDQYVRFRPGLRPALQPATLVVLASAASAVPAAILFVVSAANAAAPGLRG